MKSIITKNYTKVKKNFQKSKNSSILNNNKIAENLTSKASNSYKFPASDNYSINLINNKEINNERKGNLNIDDSYKCLTGFPKCINLSSESAFKKPPPRKHESVKLKKSDNYNFLSHSFNKKINTSTNINKNLFLINKKFQTTKNINNNCNRYSFKTNRIYNLNNNNPKKNNTNNSFLQGKLVKNLNKEVLCKERNINNINLNNNTNINSSNTHILYETNTNITSKMIKNNCTNSSFATSPTNNTNLQKNFHETISYLDDNSFFFVFCSCYENEEENDFMNYICKEMNFNLIYLPFDSQVSDYEKVINKYNSNLFFNFINYDTANEIKKKLNISENKTLLLCKKYVNEVDDNANNFSFILDYKNKDELKKIINQINYKIFIENNSHLNFDLSDILLVNNLLENTIMKKEFKKNYKNININEIICFYIPNIKTKNNFLSYKNETMLLSLYNYLNKNVKTIEIISFDKEIFNYPWINLNINIKFLEKYEKYENNLIVLDSNYQLLSINGINEIINYQYKVLDEKWKKISNEKYKLPEIFNFEKNIKLLTKSSNNLSYHNTSSSPSNTTDNNSAIKIIKRKFILLNIYSQEGKLINNKINNELYNIFTILKDKILFIHIPSQNDSTNINSNVNDNLQKNNNKHPFNFGIYMNSYSNDIMQLLINNSIDPSIISISILDNDNKNIITNISSYQMINNSLYSLFSQWISIYNLNFEKNIKYEYLQIDKLKFTGNTKVNLTSLNSVDFLLLYFNDISSKKYKYYTNILNDIYICSNKLQKIFEIIYIPNEKITSLKNLQNNSKDVIFLQCQNTDITSLYNKFNPKRQMPKLILIDRYGKIIDDNILTKIENQREYFLDYLFNYKININKTAFSSSLIQFSFLGNLFEFENTRITRNYFSQSTKYIGLLFISSWCFLSEIFFNIIKEFINKNNNVIEIIIDNIDDDKNIFNHYSNKNNNFIKIIYDYRYILYDKFNINNYGLPILITFEKNNGNLFKIFSLDNISKINEFLLSNNNKNNNFSNK